jgi:hypothetical protein
MRSRALISKIVSGPAEASAARAKIRRFRPFESPFLKKVKKS